MCALGSSALHISSRLYLYLVHHIQGPDEPNHGALFVACNHEVVYMYRVKGDEDVAYEPLDGAVNCVLAEGYLNMYHLVDLTKERGEIVTQV